MVATISTIADPFPPPAEWIAARRSSQVLLTIKDVEAMVKAGIVPENATTELLHGVLFYVDRAACGDNPVQIGNGAEAFEPGGSEIVGGADHNYVVSGLAELAVAVNSPLRHLRTQSTMSCSQTHAPVPDAVILRGPRTDYRGKCPDAADAFCVVEVADSSYERDAGEKLFAYARAGIQQYIIINLRNRTAEVYTNPDRTAGSYAPAMIVREQETLSLRVGDAQSFSVVLSDLLP